MLVAKQALSHGKIDLTVVKFEGRKISADFYYLATNPNDKLCIYDHHIPAYLYFIFSVF